VSVASAIATRDAAALPSRRDEDWRWTDLRGLIRAVPPASPPGEAWTWDGPFAALADETVTVVNGRGAHELEIDGARTVAIRFLSASQGSHATALAVRVAAGARLTLIESYEGRASGYLVDTALSFVLGEGAEVERIVVAEDGPEGVSVARAEVSLAAHARFRQTVLTLGARRQRIETRVRHPGGGAFVRLDGVYLLDRQRHADITTVVVHEGVGGETSQLTKGVAGGQARGVFQGRITVAHGADKTDARMRHDALLMSDRAEIDAKPELEIYADDVACAHGNTVGALDQEALFYARQRGIPLHQATALLTEAFVAEAVDRIEHEGARAAAQAWVAARMEALEP
jgi:Fe-S cluster assembly protein SufD